MLYPSLEDMKVDQMARAQVAHMQQQQQQVPGPQAAPQVPYPVPAEGHAAYGPAPPAKTMYPSLTEYMGLEFTPEMIAQLTPIATAVAVPQPSQVAIPAAATLSTGMIAPLSGNSVGLKRAEVSHGIREVVVCKDAKGKIGLKVKDVNKGVFIIFVQKDSPAALAGLRFGDQILTVNGTNVAGLDTDDMHKVFKKCPVNNIVIAIRDRPFERTITMHKDSTNHIGFMHKNGKIHSIVKDSSAARNGVLIDHQLLEVNGQNVVGLPEKDISRIIAEGGSPITITIIPSFIYDHMMKHIATHLVKEKMDHAIRDL